MSDDTPTFLGVADIVSRWTYTRQGVHQLMGSPDFPKPDHIVNNGRTRIWRLADIAAYEKTHPEVTNAALKAGKVARAFVITQRYGG